jgi:hypothetical protein
MIAEHVLEPARPGVGRSSSGAVSFTWKDVDRLTAGELDELEHLGRVSATAHALQTPQFAGFANAAVARPIIVLARDAAGLAGYWTGFFEQERGHPHWLYKAMFRSGPVLRDGLGEARETGLLQRFILAAEDAAEENGAVRQVVTSETLYGDAFCELMPPHGYRRDDGWATYVVELDRPLDDIWQSLDAKLRRSINTGRNRGVSVEEAREPTPVREFAAMLSERLVEGDMPIPLPSDYAERCMSLGEAQQAYTLIATHEGSVVGGKLDLIHGAMALSFQTAAMRGPLRVGDLLAWEEIAHAHARCARSLDLLGIRLDADPGSRQDGIRSFKEKFGGTLVQTPVFDRRLQPRGVKGLVVSAARLLRSRRRSAEAPR